MNAGGQQQQQQQNMRLLQAQQQRAMPEPSTAPVESSAHSGPTGTAAGNVDQRELVWTKFQLLKDKYLQDMIALYGMLSTGCTQPMPAEQLQKLKQYKDALQRMIPYLRVSKDRIPEELKQDQLDAFEKQIVNIMETFKKRRQPQAAPSQPPPSPQAPAQPAPAQQPDQVNMAGNWFSFGGVVQAPSQMPQNGQIPQQVLSINQFMQQLRLQQHRHIQQHLHQQQQQQQQQQHQQHQPQQQQQQQQ